MMSSSALPVHGERLIHARSALFTMPLTSTTLKRHRMWRTRQWCHRGGEKTPNPMSCDPDFEVSDCHWTRPRNPFCVMAMNRLTRRARNLQISRFMSPFLAMVQRDIVTSRPRRCNAVRSCLHRLEGLVAAIGRTMVRNVAGSNMFPQTSKRYASPNRLPILRPIGTPDVVSDACNGERDAPSQCTASRDGGTAMATLFWAFCGACCDGRGAEKSCVVCSGLMPTTIRGGGGRVGGCLAVFGTVGGPLAGPKHLP